MKTNNKRWVLGHEITQHPISEDYDLVSIATPPGVPGPPPHRHLSYKEAFIIIEGEMEFMIDGETKVLRAGESIAIPPNTLHTFNNLSNQVCRWVNIHSPKGFTDFFDEVGIPAGEETAQERSVEPAVIQQVIAIAADHDMRIEM